VKCRYVGYTAEPSNTNNHKVCFVHLEEKQKMSTTIREGKF
jgi:hypothetical protein